MIYFSGLRYPLSETNRKYQDKTDRDEMHLLTCIVNTAAPRVADMTHTLLSDSALLHCRAQTHTHTHTHTIKLLINLFSQNVQQFMCHWR